MYAGVIDMRSDTVTRPTPEMRARMAEAEVGDDVYGEDPTVNRLEGFAAELIGKEAALFVASGTMGNQLALFSHCLKGDELIIGEQDHIVQHEAGAGAHLTGVQLRTVDTGMGHLRWADVDCRIRKVEDIHAPRTRLVSIENPAPSETVIPVRDLEEISRGVKRYAVSMHMDGARIFNAASWLGVEARRIAEPADSVMFCLSKGLCAPVGSMLAGSRDFVARARGRRKILGGGMRQAGILAAAGLVALETMRLRVAEDREKMAMLAKALAATGLFEMVPAEVQINMFLARFKVAELLSCENSLAEALEKRRIKIGVREDGWIRFVAHNDVSFEDIQAVAEALPAAIDDVRKAAGRDASATRGTGG